MIRIILALVVCYQLSAIRAFVPISSTPNPINTRLSLSIKDSDNESSCTRRQSWQKAGQIAGAILLATKPAYAKDNLDADKAKLVAGYKRLNYLLDNWEKETTNCKTKTQYSSASNPCERTPLIVQNYLGYKSTEDPLFRANKTMRRLEVLVPPEYEVDYLDAMEKFNIKADEGA